MKSKSIRLLNWGTAALLALTAWQQPASAADGNNNTLTDAEKAAGWQLLFNGTNLDGWHNYRANTIGASWMVTNGAMGFLDNRQSGDIVSTGQFKWFELQLDYKAGPECNSGIMYHVIDAGPGTAIWFSGPEFQLEDNAGAADPVRCGWLYAMYKPPMDLQTGKELDATKPVGQWNHVRLLVSPGKCEHDINGVKYFEYVLNSADFVNRVANSKWRDVPTYAKSDTGSIGLQGDHPGSIFFRNIKIRPIADK